jgi:hypothetical protein
MPPGLPGCRARYLHARRSALATLFALLLSLWCGFESLAAEDPPTAPRRAAVMDFELINEMSDYETDVSRASLQQRLRLIDEALRREFAERGLYEVIDNAPAAALIAREKALHDLRQCNGCEFDIGHALGADIIILGWVQKISNLILNVNIEVKDVSTQKTLYTKSVDLRSNSDKSWLRGIHYMVDSIEEKKQQLR